MTEYETPDTIATIQACEAAIARVRAAIRAGTQDTEAVAHDLIFLQDAVEDRFVRYARRVATLGPQAFEEALDALNDRLLDDIWSLGYQTMETKFGSYLKTRPLRVLQQIARKYGRTSVSSIVERLDQPATEGGQALGETIADPFASAAIDQIADDDERQMMIARVRAMIDTLPTDERFAVRQRMNDRSNNEIASQLGVSIATASRIYTRALERLRIALSADGDTV
jgi:RNA polymerase sigma factor (sigma-70 family)